MPKIPEALAAARLRAASDRPYLSAAMWSLVPVAKPPELVPTMAVDQYWRLYYNPEQLVKWSVEETAGVIVHEVNHCLRDHADRAKELGVVRVPWQFGTDAEINDDLVAEGVTLPGKPAVILPDGTATPGYILPKTFGLPDGLTAEEYYAKITEKFEQEAKKRRPQKGGTPGPGQGGTPGPGKGGKSGTEKQNGGGGRKPGKDDGDQKGDGRGKGDGDRESNDDGGGAGDGGMCDGQPGAGEGDGDDGQDPQRGPGGGACGSCADGDRKPWEDDPPDPEDSTVPEGMDRAEQQLVRRHVAKEIRDAAKARGDIPGHWKSWAEQLLAPKIPWQRELSGAMRGAIADALGQVNYSYRRPSRRQSVFPKVVLPALRAPQPRVAEVVDTSGSMGDDDLVRALSEVGAVIKTCGLREGVPVIACDAKVQAVKRFTSTRGLRDMAVGRGGTDMTQGIEAAMKMRPKPDIIIVLTDGYTGWCDAPPRGVKVIICLVGKHAVQNEQCPAWARVIRCEDDESEEEDAE